MALAKGCGLNMVEDYCEANKLIDQAVMPMPRFEKWGLMLEGTAAFCTPDMIQRVLADTAARVDQGDVHHGRRAGGFKRPRGCCRES